MTERVLSMWFFIIFIPMTYLVYVLLTCFNYEKVLRKNRVRDLKILLIIVSVGISYLFAQAFLEVIERIANFLG